MARYYSFIAPLLITVLRIFLYSRTLIKKMSPWS